MLLAHVLALSANHFYARKGPYEYVHKVRIELAELILVGTRIIYETTGDAGLGLELGLGLWLYQVYRTMYIDNIGLLPQQGDDLGSASDNDRVG